MSVGAIFTLDLLGNYELLKSRFFDTKGQLEKLVSKPVSTSMSYWNVSWVLGTSFIRVPFYVFTQATASIFSCLSMSNIANRMYICSGHTLNQVTGAFSKLRWGSQLLVPSYNDYKISHWDLFTRNKIARSQVQDPEIRDSLHDKVKKVDFSARIGEGLCHGGVSWFNNLYLQGLDGSKLANQSDTYTEYGQKIASLFANGAPKEAGIIQSLYGIEKKLFPIKEISIPVSLTIDALKRLCDGVFYVKTENHALSYVKIGKEQFVWDPNEGLISIRSMNDLLSILKSYSSDTVEFVYQSLEKKSLFSRIFAFLKIR